MKYAMFAYDFNHTKTKDLILVMEHLGHKLSCILAAPKVELNLPESQIRTSIGSNEYFHPKDVAKMFDIPYFVLYHNNEECTKRIKERNCDIGIIGGARILSKKTVEAFNYGVINFHPGIIPENRGLDNLKWAIHLNIPQGVTTHFIDERIDAGRIILKKKIPIYYDDTLFDVQKRLYDTQIELVESTLEKIKGKTLDDFPLVTEGESRGITPKELERQIPQKFKKYKQKFGQEKE